MKTNNIIVAPEVTNYKELYEQWAAANPGRTESQFITLLLTPSAERTAFLAAQEMEVSFRGGMCIRKFSAK